MRRFFGAILVGLLLALPQNADACVHCVARQKANMMAARMFRGHVGGGYGGARYEGVGWGTSPQAALNSCCHYRRPLAAQAVARGPNGLYYAVKLFH